MSGFLNKPSDTISSLARDASCSRGWLRLVVQIFFFGMTVASFILILRMAMKPSRPIHKQSKCEVSYCLVQCYDAPYYGMFYDDIFKALKDTEAMCKRPSLTLNNAKFINASLPSHLFSDIRFPVVQLSIIGGNLKYLPSNNFMDQVSGKIEVLMFENIIIDTWESNSLVGLSNLKELYIKNAQIKTIEKDALRPVDDILQILSVIKSGKWIPSNLTGTSELVHLKDVVLSSNNFSNILNANSFSSLKQCEILYLNSCKISAIGEGTFDSLVNIHVLYLNNNELITIPSGLFDELRGHKGHLSRINLQGNPWMCDCAFRDFKILSVEGMLLVEPSCYFPLEVRDMFFNEFESKHCTDCSKVEVSFSEEIYKKKIMSLKNIDPAHDNCLIRRETPGNSSFKFISPVPNYQCNIDAVALPKLTLDLNKIESDRSLEIAWLQPTFLMKSDKYYLIEIDLLHLRKSGLMWYEVSCPNEVYCVSTLPNHLKIYNTNISSWYVFCPWELKTGSVEEDNCVMYDMTKMFEIDNKEYRYIRISHILFYFAVGLACLIVGAFIVYIAIRLNPGLLKGSKRLLFVKYKEVDALVLPPKVPLRSSKSENLISTDSIFLLPSNAIPTNFTRTKSVRSNSSYSPSYISVMQPSEDQLMNWRMQYLFNSPNSLTTFEETRRNSLPFFNLSDDFLNSDKS